MNERENSFHATVTENISTHLKTIGPNVALPMCMLLYVYIYVIEMDLKL